MISPRALLPLLLLVSTSTAYTGLSSSPGGLSNIYRRADDSLSGVFDGLGLSPEEIERIESLSNDESTQTPACAAKCSDREVSTESYVPLCGMTNQDGDEDIESVINAYSCICADRQYVEQSISCLVKECGKNSTALEYVLSSQYAMCRLYAKISYPKPEVFLNELCLLDDVSKDSVPTDVSLVKYVWPDYTFAKDWPEQTATTFLPTGTASFDVDAFLDSQPKWTCTPTPLSDSEESDAQDEKDEDTKEEDTKEEDTKDDTSSNNGTITNSTTTKDEDNGVAGRQGVFGMAAVVAAVAGVAIFL